MSRTLRSIGLSLLMSLALTTLSGTLTWAETPEAASSEALEKDQSDSRELAEEPAPEPEPEPEPEARATPAAPPAFEPMTPDESAANDADKGDLLVFDGGLAQVAIYGLVNVQGAAYTGEDNLLQSGDSAEQPGFRLRHGRFGLRGWAFAQLEFMLSMETADLKVRPLDAWLRYRPFEALALTLGAHKVPFSRYAMTGSAYGSLAERPLSVKAMAPFRQMGLTIHGSIGNGLASYAVGVYNGLDRHTNFHEGYVENAVFEGNRFNKVSIAGRLSLEPLGPLGADVADLDGGGFRVGVGASVLHNEGSTTRTTAWAADLALKVQGFHLFAEYISDLSQPSSDPTSPNTLLAEAERYGVSAELGYMILPGQLGLAVRGELFDDDMAVENNGDQLVISGGIQYYWHRHHFKASIDYTHREELYGSSLDNDSLLLSAHFAL